MKNKTVSVIIPTLNASVNIKQQLDMLSHQTCVVNEVVIVDSESEDNTIEIARSFDFVRIIKVKKIDFDHGKTRDMALRSCSSDFIVFLTDDAIPRDEMLIQYLVDSFEKDENIVASYGRQLPRDDASAMEKLVREFNYPEQGIIKSSANIEQMGIKTFFLSDACSCYLRQKYIEIGGFDYPVKTNEDMFFAARAISMNYKIAYEPQAQIYHSHNFTLKQQYKRNYIQGFEMESHKDILNNCKSQKQGLKLVSFVSKRLLSQGRVFSFVRFGFDCIARYLGNSAGIKAARAMRK